MSAIEMIKGRLNQCTLDLKSANDRTKRAMLIASRIAYTDVLKILEVEKNA